MSRVPRIRFKGFEEDWEQRKLGEIFKEYSEKNHVELPPLTIIQGGGTIRRDESDRALQYDKGSLSNYKMVNKDDFIVHLRSFEGGLEKANSIGIISPAYHTFSGENTDTTFYYTYFRSKKFVEIDLKPHVYGIRDGRSIDIEGMKTIKIPYTIFKEQMCIGKAIDVIDHLITLHQRKLKKLKNIKKSMLENLFPKNGEKTPRIRFSGFTEDWEQRKLGEIFIYLRNNTLSREELNDEYGVAQSIHYGDVLIKYGECLNVSNELLPFINQQYIVDKFKKCYIQNGDIIIADTAEDETVGKCTEISGIVNQNIILGLHTIPLRPVNKFANGYLGFYLNSNSYHKQLKPLMQGIKVISISKNSLKTTVLEYPSEINEQQKIGTCFQSLDHLITLHQSKLEKLRKIKKSMLESMFV
nr:restriction endonuclease subunit S [uncultured Lachnoanaerobaculum sp.]